MFEIRTFEIRFLFLIESHTVFSMENTAFTFSDSYLHLKDEWL